MVLGLAAAAAAVSSEGLPINQSAEAPSTVEAAQEAVTSLQAVSLNSKGPQPLRMVAAPTYIRVDKRPRGDRTASASPDSDTGPSRRRSCSTPLPPITGYPSLCSDKPILDLLPLPGPAGTADAGASPAPGSPAASPGLPGPAGQQALATTVPHPEPSQPSVPLTAPPADVPLEAAVQVSSNGVHISGAGTAPPSVVTPNASHRRLPNNFVESSPVMHTAPTSVGNSTCIRAIVDGVEVLLPSGGLPHAKALPCAQEEISIAVSTGIPSAVANGGILTSGEGVPLAQANGSVAVERDGGSSAEAHGGVTNNKGGVQSAQANGVVTVEIDGIASAEAHAGAADKSANAPPAFENGGAEVSKQRQSPNSQSGTCAEGVTQPHPTENDDVVVEVLMGTTRKAQLKRPMGSIDAPLGPSEVLQNPAKPAKLQKKNVQLPPPVLSRDSVTLSRDNQKKAQAGQADAGVSTPAGNPKCPASSALPPALASTSSPPGVIGERESRPARISSAGHPVAVPRQAGAPGPMPPPLVLPNVSSLQAPAPAVPAVPTEPPSSDIIELSAGSPTAPGPDEPPPELPTGPPTIPINPSPAPQLASSEAPAVPIAGTPGGLGLSTPPLRPERHPGLMTCKSEDPPVLAGRSVPPLLQRSPSGGLLPAHAGTTGRRVSKKTAKLYKEGDPAVAHCIDNQVCADPRSE